MTLNSTSLSELCRIGLPTDGETIKTQGDSRTNNTVVPNNEHEVNNNSIDSITFLESKNVNLCKVFSGSEYKATSYSLARFFDVVSKDVSCLDDLAKAVLSYSQKHTICVIRGELIDKSESKRVLRRCKDKINKETGEIERATFKPQPRQWCMFDIDNVEYTGDGNFKNSSHVMSWLRDNILPDDLKITDFFYQCSSSWGIKNDKTIKAHIWFWLDRKYSDSELKQYVKKNNLPFDTAMFNPVQVHYTANPIFTDGAIDPLSAWGRSGICEGTLRKKEAILATSVTNELSKECRVLETHSFQYGVHPVVNPIAYRMGKLVASGELSKETVIKAMISALSKNHNITHDKIQRVKEDDIPRALDDGMSNAPTQIISASDSWRSQLELNEKGIPKPTDFNILTVFKNHPSLEGLFGINKATQEVFVMKTPPWESVGDFPRILKDVDCLHISVWLWTENMIQVQTIHVSRIIRHLIENRCVLFDPFADYISALKWDGVERISNFLIDIGNAEVKPNNVEYLKAVSRKFFISVVARTLSPGCKCDTVLLLHGKQGFRKSSLFYSLLPNPSMFLDHVPSITDKDAKLVIQSKVIVEFAELESLSRAESSSVKAFLSSREDTLRVPYGRNTETFPRRCVFVGTTNSDSFLKDVTGSRRFLPVCVIAKIDTDKVLEERDQLWAEAVEAYNNNEQWWLTQEEEKTREGESEDAIIEGQWEDEINDYLSKNKEYFSSSAIDFYPTEYLDNFDDNGKRYRVSVSELMSICLKIPIQNRDMQKQFAVGKTLRLLGWKKKSVKINGKVKKFFFLEAYNGPFSKSTQELPF